jgi:hypothetical protein
VDGGQLKSEIKIQYPEWEKPIMPEKSEWEIFFDQHAPQYMQNSFTANTACRGGIPN